MSVVSTNSCSDSFNYLSAIHNDQLVVAVTDTHSQTLHSWNQFTDIFTNAWTISSKDVNFNNRRTNNSNPSLI